MKEEEIDLVPYLDRVAKGKEQFDIQGIQKTAYKVFSHRIERKVKGAKMAVTFKFKMSDLEFEMEKD